MSKKYVAVAVMLVAVLAFAACGGRGGKTLVSVNGKAITEGDLDFLGNMNPRLKAQISTPFGKKQILDNLVDQELLYQAALKKGLQRESDVKAKIELYRKVVIGQSFIESYIKNAAKEYYDKHKDEFQKLQLSDILIKFGGEEDKKARSKDAALKLADDVKKKLDGGANFADVAKESSEDPSTKNNGGDLGLVSKNDPRFEAKGFAPVFDKAFTMQVGQIAGPIEAKDGYHIITVTKGLELQPYADVEQQILFKVQNDERTKLMADIKKDAKVVYPGEDKKAEPAKPAEGAAASAVAPTPAPAPSAAPVPASKPEAKAPAFQLKPTAKPIAPAKAK